MAGSIGVTYLGDVSQKAVVLRVWCPGPTQLSSCPFPNSDWHHLYQWLCPVQGPAAH